MSSDGQVADTLPGAVVVGEFRVPAGRWFGWHTHPDHQIVWAASGVALCRVADRRTWVLPTGLALWVPAGIEHTTGASAATVLRSLYLTPQRCPVRWREPTALTVNGLLRELIGHLGDPGLVPAARQRAEAVLFDLFTPVRATAVGVPDPADDRLCRIAEELRADPADGRALADWGRLVGASARTLARLFLADPGAVAGGAVAARRGMAVNRVATRVGYASPSAFVAAFRRAVGVPPAAYGYGRTRASS